VLKEVSGVPDGVSEWRIVQMPMWDAGTTNAEKCGLFLAIMAVTKKADTA
jgi:hypothetical protein